MEELHPKRNNPIRELLKIPLSLSICSLEFALSFLQEFHQLLSAENGTPAPGGHIPRSQPPSAGVNLVHDTLDGLAAFVIPGADRYSLGQGVTADGPGAVNTHVTDLLIVVFDRAIPSPPNGPTGSAMVASLLNQVAQKIHPSGNASFLSSFAGLSYSGKAAVFQFLEGNSSMEPMRHLTGVLAFFVAFIFYSEFSTFDFKTRSLKGRPAGWEASGYAGVSDGQNEFKGYYQNRQRTETSPEFASGSLELRRTHA